MHLPGVPHEIAEQIRESMKRPTGTFMFDYHFDGIFDSALGHGTLLELVTGAILFKIDRDPALNLLYIPLRAQALESPVLN
jgi:hypothetical protein